MSLLTNLISYWKLDEASGNAADAQGSNTLTNNGSIAYAAGKINNGATLVRTSSKYFSITDASQSGLDITGDFSLSMWVKLASDPAFDTIFALINKRDTGAGSGAGAAGYQIQMSHYPSGIQNIQVSFHDSGGNRSGANTADLNFTTGVWYHIVVVFVAATPVIKIYFNNSDISPTTSPTNATSIGANARDFRIGKTEAGDYFDGMVDEVGIWSRALNATEVGELYNSGAGLAYPLTVASANGNFLGLL